MQTSRAIFIVNHNYANMETDWLFSSSNQK